MNKTGQTDIDSLDVEFRKILCRIKDYIPYVTSNYYLSQYKTWLERLNDTSDSEKVARNYYLRELSKQIRKNSLSHPFNQVPPSGTLRVLPVSSFVSPKFSEDYDHTHHSSQDTLWTFDESEEFTDASLCSHYSPSGCFIEPSQTVLSTTTPTNYVSIEHPSSNKIERENKSTDQQPKHKTPATENINHGDFTKDLKELCDDLHNVQLELKKNVKKSNNVSTNPHDDDMSSVREDSSWCDLTDVDSVVALIGSGDAEKQKKNDAIDTMEKIDEDRVDFSSDGDKETEDGIMSSSMEAAKLKLQDIMESKSTLKDTNFISEDWKKTIEGLQLRLTETVGQNNEFKSIIDSLEMKNQMDEIKYRDDIQKTLKQCQEQYEHEILKLKEMHMEKLKILEKSFQSNFEQLEKTYCERMDRMTENYDLRINQMRHDHENYMKEKEYEIQKLNELIHSQCDRIISEVAEIKKQINNCCIGDEKMQTFQKCLTKLDKMFQRAEKDYCKQIQKMKQEIELKERAMQIQFSAQRAELLATSTSVRQNEFEEIINSLEVKYIKMMEQHEYQIMQTKKEDDAKTKRLVALLDKHNISYENF